MSLDQDLRPVQESSLGAYFRDRLLEHARQLRPPPHEDTCWYLGTLLERFSRSANLFANASRRPVLRPLALLYQDARDAPSEHQRCEILQQLGDTALFVGALFPARYARFGIQTDYFAGMGGGAYEYLAENARGNRHIFSELASTFLNMLVLVARACSRQHPGSHTDVLQLYQRWLETGDALAARQLRAVGIELDGSQWSQ